jgi:hypothetical protein
MACPASLSDEPSMFFVLHLEFYASKKAHTNEKTLVFPPMRLEDIPSTLF